MSKTRAVYIATICTIFVLFLSTALSWDYDLGFRLRTGELILLRLQSLQLTNLQTYKFTNFPDPYSYTMPSFPYVEHSWGTGIIWAFLYRASGTYGIALFQIILFVLTIAVTRVRIQTFKPFPQSGITLRVTNLQTFIAHPAMLLGIAALLPFFGMRSYVSGWLWFTSMLLIFEREKNWHRWRFFLPLLFFLWANTHGSFLMGLAIAGFLIAVCTVLRRRIDAIDVSLVAASTAATLMNPYGMELWREVMMTMLDASLRSAILEWQPVYARVDLAFPAFLVMALVFIGRYHKKFAIEEKALASVMLIAAIVSIRNVPFFILTALPFLFRGIEYFADEARHLRGARDRLQRSLKVVQIAGAVLIAFVVVINASHAYRIKSGEIYPAGTLAFLKQQSPEGELFAPMHWGGYLIFYYPEKKVFVDGRMVSWRWRQHPENERNSAFDAYLAIASGIQDYRPYFEQYNITTVLWENPEPSRLYRTVKEAVPILEFALGTPAYGEGFIMRLEKDGWEKIYEDETAIVLTVSHF